MKKLKYAKIKRPKRQSRHTHKTAAAFEDAIAIQIDIIRVLMETIEYVRHRATNTLEVLQAARKGPHAYDPDRPAGKRKTITYSKR